MKLIVGASVRHVVVGFTAPKLHGSMTLTPDEARKAAADLVAAADKIDRAAMTDADAHAEAKNRG